MDLAHYFIGNMDHQLQSDHHLGHVESNMGNNMGSLQDYDRYENLQSQPQNLQTQPQNLQTTSQNLQSQNSQPQDLQSHQDVHTPVPPPEISESFHKCDICNQIYGTEYGLKQHVNIMHKEKKFVCSICKKGCNTDGALEIHMRIHKDKCLLCPYCGLKFAGRYSLRRHVQKHVSVKRFRCHICKKMLKTKASLQKHIADHESSEVHQCSLCPKSFPSGAKLALHIRRNHSGEKPHACSLCGKRFFARSDLKDHTKIHYSDDGVTLLQCPICWKFFDRKNNLETHMKSHDGKKTHKCPICNKEYAHSWGLKEHMYTHNSNNAFQCNICGKQLKNYSTYRYHKTTHSTEKKFKCSLCSKQFLAKSGIQKHMLMHQRQEQNANIEDEPESSPVLQLLEDDEDTEGKVLCNICGKWLKKTSVRGHMEAHKRRMSDRKFQCSACSKYFFTSRGLELHTMHYCPVERKEVPGDSADGATKESGGNSDIKTFSDLNRVKKKRGRPRKNKDALNNHIIAMLNLSGEKVRGELSEAAKSGEKSGEKEGVTPKKSSGDNDDEENDDALNLSGKKKKVPTATLR